MSNKKSKASIIQIKKPASFSEKFKSKNAPTISGVETLLTALPILKIGDVGDYCRLHPSEDEYWTPELCFVSVPIKGNKRDTLHLIDDDLAVQYLPAKKIKRFRLALACKPHDVFFWCIVPSQNLDNPYIMPMRSRPASGRRRIGLRRCRDDPRVPRATKSSSRKIRAPSPNRNGRRVRGTSCWKRPSKKPTSTMTATLDSCA